MKNKLLFIPFKIFKKCSIPFKLFKKFSCRENGGLQLVSEQVGPSGQVVKSRSVSNSCITVFKLS